MSTYTGADLQAVSTPNLKTWIAAACQHVEDLESVNLDDLATPEAEELRASIEAAHGRLNEYLDELARREGWA